MEPTSELQSMAIASKRTIRKIENAGEDVADALSQQIDALRSELATLADAVNDYGGGALVDIRHDAGELVKQVRHQGAVAAREISKQAHVAGKAVRDNPVPLIVTLGTIALVSALIFTADQRLRH